MSKLNKVTSTTNNQSNPALSSKAPFLLAHDNFKVKGTIKFLYNGTKYTLEQLVTIFALTQLKG